jgi:hypothetical protein
MDLFGTTGQQRRTWLDGVDQRIGNALSRFLGPSGLDQRANALATVGPMMMDGADYQDAVTGSRNLFSDPSLANALAFATPMVALAMPGVSARMAEGVADFGGDLARFAGDESGALRLPGMYHGTPRGDFDTIKTDMKEPGAWFTKDLRYAHDYAKDGEGAIFESNLRMDRPAIV